MVFTCLDQYLESGPVDLRGLGFTCNIYTQVFVKNQEPSQQMCFSKVVVKYVSIWVEKSHSGVEMRLIPQQCINL